MAGDCDFIHGLFGFKDSLSEGQSKTKADSSDSDVQIELDIDIIDDEDEEAIIEKRRKEREELMKVSCIILPKSWAVHATRLPIERKN